MFSQTKLTQAKFIFLGTEFPIVVKMTLKQQHSVFTPAVYILVSSSTLFLVSPFPSSALEIIEYLITYQISLLGFQVINNLKEEKSQLYYKLAMLARC